MKVTTQRIELAKQAAAIMADQELDFDQACSAVVGLIQDTTGGAPLLPEFASREEYDFSKGVRGKYAEKKIVPVESLAPICPESPSGKHCRDHRYRKTSFSIHELRCCWCKATIDVKITQMHVITEGHGPQSGYDEERFAMPEGWEEGA